MGNQANKLFNAEFVQLLSSEANEIATKEKKNTITPEHLLKAIRDLGFTDFIEEVTATMEQQLSLIHI